MILKPAKIIAVSTGDQCYRVYRKEQGGDSKRLCFKVLSMNVGYSMTATKPQIHCVRDFFRTRRPAMLKKLSVFFLVLLSTFLCVSTVFAWDDLIYLQPGYRIAESGTMAGTVFFRYGSASDRLDKDGKKQKLADTGTELRIPIMADYVVINNLKAFAILPIVSQNKNISPDGKDNSGIGDLWLGAKYAVMPEGLFTVRGALDIPTGNDKNGIGNAGGFGIDVAALTGKKIDKISLNGGVGIRYNAEDSDTKWQPGIGFYLNGGVTYAITEKIPAEISLTYLNYGDGKTGGKDAKDSTVNWLEIVVGTFYGISENFGAGLHLEYKLTGANTPSDFGIGAVVGYSFSKK